jgi:hypothetical protein
MLSATRYKQPNIKRISLDDWKSGTVTAFDDGRTPVKGLRSSGNVVLDQDGTLRPRPSLLTYGTALPGTLIGELYEFVQVASNVSTNWLIAMFNVGGTARPYLSKDGGVWQVTTGKIYSITAPAHFTQVGSKLLIMNGEDNLSVFDTTTAGTTNVITPFTALTAPAAPTLTTNTGLTGTATTVYYRVSANSSVGETEASGRLAQQVSLQRASWVKGTHSIKIGWTAVTGAKSYNVYVGETIDNQFLLVSGVNALEFTDDGSIAYASDKFSPVSNSTAGPKATRATVINDRPYLVGVKDNRYAVYVGGTGENVLDFSPFGGGGLTEINKGGKEYPVRVMPFRDGRGNAQVTVLCRGTNGRGKRFTMTPDTITLGTTTIDYFAVVEDNGQDGTDSPDGVLLYNDSLWYPSRDGFKTTGTQPQLQNLLSTRRVSNTIQGDIKNLNNSAMDKCVGLAFEGRLYWALPVGSTNNNEIWVLDLERDGAWMKPWNISADWMVLYNDNSGVTHFLVLQGNVISEFTYSQATSDNGVAFGTSAASGLIKFSEDGMDWAKVIDVTFFLQRPQGAINLLVAGKTEDSSLANLGSDSYISDSSIAGWSEAGWSEAGWSEVVSVPTQYGDSSKPVVIEIDEELQWLTWELSTTGTGVNYQLTGVVIRFVPIGTKDLT